MKQSFLLILILTLAYGSCRATTADRALKRARTEIRTATVAIDREVRHAVAEARAAIDAAERIALRSQSLDELNEAMRDEVVRELKLTKSQLRKFEPLYNQYRKALREALDTRTTAKTPTDEKGQQRLLKAKLANIAATAEVKRAYVDRFAEVLTADQIRRLYNTEGQISTSIKRADGSRQATPRRLRGSGRMVTQDWGKAGDYTGISAASFFEITISPTATSISVTADDNVIDHLTLDRSEGQLRFRVNATNTENISVSVVLPPSAALRNLSAGSYGKIRCKMPLKGRSVRISVSSYGSVAADIAVEEEARLDISSYGKFSGSVSCNDCVLNLSSYGSVQAPIVCRNLCRMEVGSYAKFADDIRAAELSLQASSGASVSSHLNISGLTRLNVGSYATFSGEIRSRQADLTVQSGGTLDAAFAGRELKATVGSYGKIRLQGTAEVASAAVRVSSGASYTAPDLRVEEYDLTVSNYSKADVWCSGHLKIDASPSASVSYDGPATVEAFSKNIRRKK